MAGKQVGQGDVAAKIAELTERQCACLRLVSQLHTSKTIAAKLGISPHSVDDRIRRSLQTLGVSTRAQAAQMLIEYEANTPQHLMHQPSRLVQELDLSEAGVSPGGFAPFSDGVLNELAEGQAAFFPTSHSFAPRTRWSFWEIVQTEHNLPIWGRLAAIFGVALMGVIVAALLVNLAEGFSRLA